MNNNYRLQGDESISDENSEHNRPRANNNEENKHENRRNDGDQDSLNGYLDIIDDANSNQTVMSDIPIEEDIIFCSDQVSKQKDLSSKFGQQCLLINCI